TAKTYLLVTIRFACIEFNCLSRSASGLGAAHVSTISDRRFGNQHREERWPKSRNFVGAHCRHGCSGVSRRRCESRRRRRELLAARVLREPRGGSPVAGMVADKHLLSYLGVGRW